MAEQKLIQVYVTYDQREYSLVSIPADINEVQLKAYLRDLGYIASYRLSYLTTKVYLKEDLKNSLKEICTVEYRSLEELGIVQESVILIRDGRNIHYQ